MLQHGMEWFEDWSQDGTRTEMLLSLWTPHPLVDGVWDCKDWTIVCDSYVSVADCQALEGVVLELRRLLQLYPGASLSELVSWYKSGERSSRSPHLAVPSG
jgi:hypothetical protein